ncbi:acetate kinase [Eikenella sp. NML03-A-027]|uniref:Acetate kinase n=1 Tax=Eikenella exigua TaxID=2528037 RepID=A0AAX1F9G0_9NEIS|nr:MULTISPECIES: acetate kinase [Eikenella]OAM28227.1 acetate kinase [Eikenella sp. NML01-A-086]OAM32457.1 acetate kinase [Eikenella sp. NML03-A-027]OAM42000.1 acetate kinase [Eikenella sp. NML97-A-109]QED92736.1 acetate kinase [Eikenella exigua]
MSDKLILVLNCGSSSVKGAVLDSTNGEVLLSCLAEKLHLSDARIIFKANGEKRTVSLAGKPDHTGAVEALMSELEARKLDKRIGAVGHRVVHGGERFKESCLINDEVIKGIEECIMLAPLHNPANLLGIRAAMSIFSHVPHAVVFDTAFHQSMPEYAYTYAVPRELYRQYGLRRYGAHGTSYRFVAIEAARLLGRSEEGLRLVIAHLGNGASIAASNSGKCCDTSMGLTPLEGLVMGTRSGDIDANVFPFLHNNVGLNIEQITDLLHKQSGLLGISELSNDCREIEEAASKGHEGAKLALEVFSYRLAKYVASMSVAAGGLDALVFTGGIGENSSTIRSKTIGYLGFLGLTVDEKANLAARFGEGGIISQAGSTSLVMVIPTNEELMIAQDTAHLASIE